MITLRDGEGNAFNPQKTNSPYLILVNNLIMSNVNGRAMTEDEMLFVNQGLNTFRTELQLSEITMHLCIEEIKSDNIETTKGGE